MGMTNPKKPFPQLAIEKHMLQKTQKKKKTKPIQHQNIK